AHELVQATVAEQAVSLVVGVHPMRRTGGLAVEEHTERDRPNRPRGEHQMRVARVKAVRDAAAGPVQHYLLLPNGPFAGQCPMVEPQPFRELVGAAVERRGETRTTPVTEICLGRTQMVPVGRGLDAARFDGGGLAFDPEQSLDDTLGCLVAAFAEVVVAD